MRYNDADRIVNVLDTDNNKMEYQFQDEGKVVSITWPDNRVRVFSYRADGNLSQIADGCFELDNTVKKIKFDRIITY